MGNFTLFGLLVQEVSSSLCRFVSRLVCFLSLISFYRQCRYGPDERNLTVSSEREGRIVRIFTEDGITCYGVGDGRNRIAEGITRTAWVAVESESYTIP